MKERIKEEKIDGIIANTIEFLKERIKEEKIDGIIANTIEFCDLNGCENMVLEHDIQRYKTRIEAFIEQVE
ncbi:MAG: hypothetical protein ACTSWY_01495 [Promethearchaeota archaeon]